MSFINKKNNLEKTIEYLRKEMIKVGIEEGLSSKSTIRISRKLDRYIAKYQLL